MNPMSYSKTCYCGSDAEFEACCQPYINGSIKAPTAEALMRSRYSAYATHAVDYLMETTHPSQRKYYSKSEIKQWAISNIWMQLKVLSATATTVEFQAYYTDGSGKEQLHHEKSTFALENGSWFYVDGQFY